LLYLIKKLKAMLRFLKSVFKSVLVTFISFIIIVGVFVVIGLSASMEEEEKTKSNSLLEINLSENIVDRSSEFSFDFGDLSDEPKSLGLDDILKSIDKAKYDNNIKGIYLNIDIVNSNMASLEEVRDKLQDFKDSTDKFILSYSEVYSQKAFYISSVADKIYLHPEGYLEFKGLNYEGMFFKEALEKLEIEPQIIRHGKFKSAVEPFILDKMSDSNREQVKRFIGSIWEDVKEDIADGRNLSDDELNNIAENLLVQSAKDAVDYKLADALQYQDQVDDSLRKRLNLESDKKIEKISLRQYIDVGVSTKKKFSKDKIAVIYAQGSINSGEGDNETIGSETTSKAIRKARKNDKIKAIVLRVNSPGGSALASETILREMELAKEVKPVVVSMGDVAASGGYYIACKADTIVANPTTITGSIGVFGVLMNLEKMMKNKLGITTDRVKTNQFADLASPTRALNESERAIIQNQVEMIYDKFITHVAEGRNMTKEEVDSIGQGRVWTGKDAIELGLVDVLGGMEDAIAIAADMANLDSYRITKLPIEKNPFEKIIEDLGGQVKTRIIKSELGNVFPYYKKMNELMNIEEIQMRMPNQFEIY
jgi:protease-4